MYEWTSAKWVVLNFAYYCSLLGKHHPVEKIFRNKCCECWLVRRWVGVLAQFLGIKLCDTRDQSPGLERKMCTDGRKNNKEQCPTIRKTEPKQSFQSLTRSQSPLLWLMLFCTSKLNNAKGSVCSPHIQDCLGTNTTFIAPWFRYRALFGNDCLGTTNLCKCFACHNSNTMNAYNDFSKLQRPYNLHWMGRRFRNCCW
jgi:hypothetical protein